MKPGIGSISFLALFLFATFGYAEMRIASVSESYRTATDFTRIPEYFTGKEYRGNQAMARTRDDRAGLYFVLEVDWDEGVSLSGSNVLIQVVRSDQPQAESYKLGFPSEGKPGKEVFLGITGKDWASQKIKPIAWRIEIRDAEGKLLAERQSFLWGHPK